MSSSSPDSYQTVAQSLRAPELKVKGSRFIAEIHPVTTKAMIEARLAEVRKEFYDASHHCFAYRLGPTATLMRAADAGEPTGTAGKPILLVLTHAKLTDTLLIVTRYFGGTKLGTGGLARAYAESAQQVVSLASVKTILLTEEVTLQVPYSDLPAVERLIAQFQGAAGDHAYLDSVQMTVQIRRSKLQDFVAQATEQLNGRIGILSK